MNENRWFWTGLALLGAAAFYVPRFMGLHPVAAFVVGVSAAAIYVWGFTYVAGKVPVEYEEEDEE